MIALGSNLGIKVTAEGVETVEQLQMLRDLDCDCGQGYLFARPLHPADVPGVLADWHRDGALRLLGAVEAL
jgi:EAL domain-containing protein (putative c-di-GMP-specific phosphodiesterase class I)